MPYSQIHWIKLEKRLLNDPRFFTMSETSQLIYIKFLLLCAQFNNKVSRSVPILQQLLRSAYDEVTLLSYMKEIQEHFPKVLTHKDFYYIKGFKEMHNWVSTKELRGNSEGTPKELVDKIRIDKIIQEYIKVKNWDVINNPLLLTDVYRRNGRAAKNLLLIANNDTLAIKAMNNMAEAYNQKGLNWTLETLIKHYPEFIKSKPKDLADLRIEAKIQ